MRKLVLSLVLLAGTLAGVMLLPSKADAQRWWRRGYYGSYYPGTVYTYPAYGGSYYTPAYSSYYYSPGYASYYSTPAYSYTPAYATYYYPSTAVRSYYTPGYAAPYYPAPASRSYYYSPGYYMWP